MIEINKNVCIGCGRCAADCTQRNLVMTEQKAAAKGDCFLCGHCVALCPSNAISIPEYDMGDVEEIDPEQARLDSARLLRAIKFRRSIRNFQPRPIPRPQLEQLVQAGRYTATSKNTQDCRFILVQEELEAFKALIWDQIGQELTGPNQEAFQIYAGFYKSYRKNSHHDFLFRNAPAVLFIAAHDLTDAGLAAQNMELMGTSLGLGFLYNGYLRRAAQMLPQALTWLGLDERTIGVCALAGYPAVTYVRTAPRRKADVIYR